jgi:hypothetical protein
MKSEHSEELLRITADALEQEPRAYNWISIQTHAGNWAEKEIKTLRTLYDYLTEPPAKLKANAEQLRDELANYAAKNLITPQTRLQLAQLAVRHINLYELALLIALGELYQRENI